MRGRRRRLQGRVIIGERVEFVVVVIVAVQRGAEVRRIRFEVLGAAARRTHPLFVGRRRDAFRLFRRQVDAARVVPAAARTVASERRVMVESGWSGRVVGGRWAMDGKEQRGKGK